MSSLRSHCSSVPFIPLVRKKLVREQPARTKPAQKQPVPQTPRQREINTKRRGELAELTFVLIATNLGFGAARPYGDSERYDVILDRP